MSEKASILSVLAPVTPQYPPAAQRIFAALGRRIAAARYRAWAEATDDASAAPFGGAP